MALPLTRDITLGSLAQIPAALLNKLQDMIIGGKHGELVQMIHAMEGETRAFGFEADPVVTYWANNSGTDVVVVPLRFPVGTKIKGIRVYGADTGSDEFDAEVFEVPALTATAASLAAMKSSGLAGGDTSFEWTEADSGFPFVLEDEKTYHVFIQIRAVCEWHAVRVVYERP